MNLALSYRTTREDRLVAWRDPFNNRAELAYPVQLFDAAGVFSSWSEEMMEHITIVLIAIGVVSLLAGREWYNSLAGLILAVLGLWMSGYLPR